MGYSQGRIWRRVTKGRSTSLDIFFLKCLLWFRRLVENNDRVKICTYQKILKLPPPPQLRSKDTSGYSCMLSWYYISCYISFPIKPLSPPLSIVSIAKVPCFSFFSFYNDSITQPPIKIPKLITPNLCMRCDFAH